MKFGLYNEEKMGTVHLFIFSPSKYFKQEMEKGK